MPKDTGEQDTEEEVTTEGADGDTDGKETKPDTKEEETSLEGVTISEEFQQKCYELIESASKAECDYMRDACYRRQDDIRSEERKEEMKDSKNKPNAVVKFTDSDMPSLN